MPGSWSPGSGNGHLDVLRNASTKDPRYAVDSEESSCVRFESETIPVFFSRFCMPWFLTLFASKTPMRLQQAASVILPPFIACLGATSMSCPRASAAKHTTVTVHLRDDYCNRKAWNS